MEKETLRGDIDRVRDSDRDKARQVGGGEGAWQSDTGMEMFSESERA